MAAYRKAEKALPRRCLPARDEGESESAQPWQRKAGMSRDYRLQITERESVFVSASTVKLHFGSSAPPSASIPKLDASNDSLVASQVDGSGRASVRNSLSDSDFLRFAIAVVDHNPHEFDRTAPHSELNRTKSPIPDANCNVVVIHTPVYMRCS